MNIETEQELFDYWMHHNMSPKRLIENYVARNNLTEDDKRHMLQIVKFACFLEKLRWESES